MRNILLVGLMGCGKSTLGRLLARRVGSLFFDSDDEIERRAGVSIATIFELEGETRFREREAAVISDLCKHRGMVLATGGGAVLNSEVQKNLQATGVVVYLHANPNLLVARTRGSRSRPLLNVSNREEKLRELYEYRDPIYRQVADVVVESDLNRASAQVSKILRAVREWESLNSGIEEPDDQR